MIHDLRYALRTIRQAPLFGIIVVLSLALGIGANTAVFSLLDQALLRSLPVREPDRLVLFHVDSLQLRGTTSSDNYETVFSLDMLRQLRKQPNLFTGTAARGSMPPVVLGGSTNEYVSVELVSGNYFDVLGVQAILGRTITPEDDRVPGERPVVVLPWPTWMKRFGGDPKVVGSTLRLNGSGYTVVGVLPPRFGSVLRGEGFGVVVPISMQRQIFADMDGNAPDVRWVNLVARLQPGVTLQQASAGIQPMWKAILDPLLSQRKGPPAKPDAYKLELVEGSRGINPLNQSLRTPLLILMGTVGLVLLIACVNIAGLMLARAQARQRDTAIRLSLGAGRLRILRQSMTETFVLAVAGGALGLLLASWITGALLKLAGYSDNATLEWHLDVRILAFAAVASIVTALLFGSVPALQMAAGEFARALNNRSLPASHAAVRKALVAGQIALATVLLFSAGLFARSLQNLMTVDPGFRTERVIKFDLSPRQAGYDKVRGNQFYADLHQRLLGLPGVTAAGGLWPGPMSNSNRGANLTVAGYQPPQGTEAGANIHAATPGFLQTLGIPLLAGRHFTEADRDGAPLVVIVNDAFSRNYCQGPAVGRKMAWGSGTVKPNIEIVGVAGNTRDNLRERPRPEVYIPYGQEQTLQRLTFYMRSAVDEKSLAAGIRDAVRSLDANLPVDNIGPLQEQVSQAVSSDRVLAILCTTFAAVAVLLTAIGVYGVIAWTVARRSNELAVRMALGAMPGRILGLVLSETTWLAGAGIAAGVALALFSGRFAEAKLFGVTASDPVMLTVAIVASGVVALLATALPAWRATRIHPAEALRMD